MFELLSKESWTLSINELIEKKKQVRQLMFIIYFIWASVFAIGLFTWVGTTKVVFPIAMMFISIILFNVVVMLKIGEIVLSSVICNKKGCS